MTLDIKDWGVFPLSAVFPKMEAGKVSQACQLEEGQDLPYIGAKKENNGVMAWRKYNSELVSRGNCVVLICDGQGSVGYANYMESDFLGTVNLMLCYNEEHMNKYVGLFLATVLSQERRKYSFGRKWKRYINDTLIKLPQTSSHEPDWAFMEDYIRSIYKEGVLTENTNTRTILPAIKTWKEYRLGALFTQIYRAEAHIKTDLEYRDFPFADSLPFISRTEANNGCDCYVSPSGLAGIESGNTIVIGDTTATCTYQPGPFVCGDHIVVCRAPWINVYTALFVITLLNAEKYRYSYGRAFKMQLIFETMICLPSTEDGEPDWKLIENYIKSLPYGDKIKRT